jgi:hypothetical protein
MGCSDLLAGAHEQGIGTIGIIGSGPPMPPMSPMLPRPGGGDEIAVRLPDDGQLDQGTRAGSLVLTRRRAAGKWGAATYSLVGT